jgi:hypothetical protein
MKWIYLVRNLLKNPKQLLMKSQPAAFLKTGLCDRADFHFGGAEKRIRAFSPS